MTRHKRYSRQTSSVEVGFVGFRLRGLEWQKLRFILFNKIKVLNVLHPPMMSV